MVCYHPIKAFVIGTTLDGKKIHRFANKEQRDLDYLYVNGKYYYEYDLLPCGHCIGCAMKRSKDWATRMMLELEYHEKACFITLTYNDENLPTSHYVDENGEEQLSFTLYKKHLQDFMKRLRKHYAPEKIRFFACGEYGDKSRRPHYHAILYGVDFSENRYVFGRTEDGYVQYRSPVLEQLWKYGYSMICEVSYQTAAYVSRYCTKKQYGIHKMHYQYFNIVPEFNLMSRRPGIANQWFEDHKGEIYDDGKIYLKGQKGGLTVRPPTYYDKLFDIEYPDEMFEIKQARKEMAKNVMEQKLQRTSLNMYELLEVEERQFKDRTASLKRDKV